MYDGFLGGLVRRYGWRKVQIGSWVLAATGILIAVPLMLFPGLADTLLSGILACSGFFLFLFAAIVAMLISNRRRRYAAFDVALVNTSSEDMPHAEEQPVPDIAALELPADIDIEIRKPITRITTIAIWLMAIIAWLIFVSGFVVTRDVFLFIVVVTMAVTMIASLFHERTSTTATNANGQHVRVGENGIVVSSDRRKLQVIAWDDVRVFALIQDIHHSQTTKCYVLSSGDNEVHWEHRPRTHWYSWTAPTTSDEVYNQQMEALLSYVAARTGLPLLDMR